MNILENKYLIENLSNFFSAGFLAFVVSFLLTPIAGKIAYAIGAVDVPARLRKKTERGFTTRLQDYATPRLGGLAILAAIIVGLIATNSVGVLPKGIIIGGLVIVLLGFLDDTFELDGKFQLAFQFLAAAIVVISGISITNIHFLGIQIDFNMFSAVIEFLGFSYNFIFPADIITLFWIVGLMNVVNWVGGVDGLSLSISSIASFTLFLFAAASGNIPLAIIMAVHLGSILGVLPFNYNPAKIYSGMGDYINGYLLAVFAIIGSTRWTATLILLGLPIVDGVLVLIMRLRAHPELRKKPWKILSISDTNHLHHRLLASGYSRKTVLLVEVAIMASLCATAIVFGDIRTDVTAFIVAATIILVSFSIVFVLKKRNQKNEKLELLGKFEEEEKEPVKEAVIKTIQEDDDDERKFVY